LNHLIVHSGIVDCELTDPHCLVSLVELTIAWIAHSIFDKRLKLSSDPVTLQNIADVLVDLEKIQ
jgi:hypothetical protein